MTPIATAQLRGQKRLLRRLEDLERRLDAGEDCWTEYCQTIVALAALPTRDAGVPSLMTTKELADRLGCSSKTVMRRRAKGDLAPALELGKRTVRW